MIRERGWHHAAAVMSAPGLLQERSSESSDLSPVASVRRSLRQIAPLLAMEAMGNVPLNHRLTWDTSNRMGGVLLAPLLVSVRISWLGRKLEAKLTLSGRKRYKEARENYSQLSHEMLSLLQSSASETGIRGKGFKLTIALLCEMLGRPAWYERRISRVFTGEAFLSEREARHLCNTLKLDFNQDDFETKFGTAPEWKWGSPPEIESERKGFVGREARKDDEGDLEDREPDYTQQPCNPAALSAAASDGSIPDPFARSDFHLKVSVEDTAAARLQLASQARPDAASLSCCMRFSLYQGNDVVPLAGLDEVLMDSFCLADDNPSPLIDKINQLRESALVACLNQLGDAETPLRLHLHLALPVTWLSGLLPDAILLQLSRQVFFGCSRREALDESAVTQLRSQAIKANRILHSGSSLSSLNWATVCHQAVQPIPADLFPHSDQVLHRNAGILDSEADHLELVGRDALLATEKGLLFPDPFNDAGDSSPEGTLNQRWRRLVELGLPLVFWWRGAGPLAKGAGLDRLGAVLKGSWSEFCDDLHLLKWKVNPIDHENLVKKNLLAYLGIFYEEPLRRHKPAAYRHPLHPAP